jgi:2,3-bisphosphoglycerate-independent phosphoglycerate mutase
MSAFEVTDEVVKRIRSGSYDVIIMNYANPDMVGHTGIMDAAVKACETVDLCLSRVIPEILGAGGTAFITADHGNAEKMVDPETGGPFTAHTSGNVPFIATDKGLRLRDGGMLADIAPTILDIMGIAKPSEMSGESLVLK